MKVILKIKGSLKEGEQDVLTKFFNFLQKELKISKDVTIQLLDVKDSNMTTGVRVPNHIIKVLYKDRMFVDVLRTIAHEWAHEYEHQKMGVKEHQKMLKIGGWGENYANAISGILIKKFVKDNKDLEEILY
jgi:sRNA-binding carbon storage regulator CsrA